MKIAVVSYKELNMEKTEAQVIEDVISSFKDSNEQTQKEFGEELRKSLEELEGGKKAEVVFIDTSDGRKREMMNSAIKEVSPDLLVSYNLAGFEQCTLTDGLGYNLIDCRQFHFRDEGNHNNEKMLEKDKSINMFFFHK